MTIKDIKDLEKVIKLCRKLGVDAIKVDGVEFQLGQVRDRSVSIRTQPPQYNSTFLSTGITEDTKIEIEELTEEQLLFYSAVQGEVPESQQ